MRDLPNTGVVKAIAGDSDAEFKVGDHVIYDRHTQQLIEIEGERLTRVKVEDVQRYYDAESMRVYILSGMKYGNLHLGAADSLSHLQGNERKQTVLVSESMRPFSTAFPTSCPKSGRANGRLRGAIKYAKTKYSDVVVLSTYGKGWPVDKRRRRSSLTVVAPGGWTNLTTPTCRWCSISDQKSANCFTRVSRQANRSSCLATKAKAPPFPMVDDLYLLLKDSFPKHEIVKLSEIHCEKIFDLCGLYDKASALVSIECVNLHLSKASGVPVVALVTDKPEFWRGTAYQKRFLVHCRYGDYQFRRPEIVKAVQAASRCGRSQK